MTKKKIILVITDNNPWVNKRMGYSHPHIRKDILLIDNGFVLNLPIQPYYNEFSDPNFSYCDVTNDCVTIKNLAMQRTKTSTCKTYCLKIQNANNIEIENVTVHTPKSNLYGDAILTFNNCTNVTLTNIIIDGTYSQKTKYGYGISMNNVYNCTINNLFGDGEWGIFGTNNVNTVHIDNSNINRFDIHCYGKDVYCHNTLFRRLYNQFSSFYGELVFHNCMFDHFIPVTIDGSYSSYTSFDVRFNNCKIIVDPKRPFLFNMTTSSFLIDSIRPELSKFCWPNIYLYNVNIYSESDTNSYYIYHTYESKHINLYKPIVISTDNLNYNFKKLSLSNSMLFFP